MHLAPRHAAPRTCRQKQSHLKMLSFICVLIWSILQRWLFYSLLIQSTDFNSFCKHAPLLFSCHIRVDFSSCVSPDEPLKYLNQILTCKGVFSTLLTWLILCYPVGELCLDDFRLTNRYSRDCRAESDKCCPSLETRVHLHPLHMEERSRVVCQSLEKTKK